jgi:hypothetical protein
MTISSFGQRKVLVEQFTNSGCPPCSQVTPVIASYVNANLTQVLMLAYHTQFPYQDSMYYENATQSTARVAYYSIGSVPNSKVDGNYYSGQLSSTVGTTIPAASGIAPRYSIGFIESTLNGNMFHAKVVFQSTDIANQNQSLVAHIVLAEKKVLKSAYLASPGNNSETEYPWVVRRMLPNENGTALINTSIGGLDTVEVNWTLNNVKDLSELRVVSFVQNINTKAVYQTEVSTPQTITGISTVGQTSEKKIVVYPTIARDHFTIENLELTHHPMISIYDAIGNLIQQINTPATTTIISTSNFKSGIYFVQVKSEMGIQTNKVIINQ